MSEKKAKEIVDHWHKKLKDSHRERKQLLGYRIEEAKRKLAPNAYPAPHLNKVIYIAKCGDYTPRFCNVWFDCDCPAFLYSGSENKQPCKHLYALALWVLNQ